MFEVGQDVVCIDDSPTDIYGTRDLIKNKIYTVEWSGIWDGLFTMDKLPRGPLPCVRLVGLCRTTPQSVIDNVKAATEAMGGYLPQEFMDKLNFLYNAPFAAERFAPIQKQEKKTDIGVFEGLLKTVPTKVLEDVE